MKIFNLIIFLFVTCLSTISAQVNWKSLYNQNGINISYGQMVCSYRYELFGLRVENTQNTAKNIHFKAKVRDGNGPVILVIEFNRTVNGQSVITGDCSDSNGQTGLNRFCATPIANAKVEIEIL